MKVDTLRVAISAGGSGIGRAIAETFLAAGCFVYVLDVDGAALKEFGSAHSRLITVEADVSDPDDVDRFFERIAADGPELGVLINNAGIAGPTGRLETIGIADWRRTIEIDLNSVFYMTRRAIPMLRANHGGVIINMASNAALFGCPLRSPYAAAKWAMIGITKTLAMELGGDNIRVNAICPGCVEGPRIDRVITADATNRGLSTAAVAAEYKSQSSMRTFVSNDDITAVVQFLSSPLGSRISGQAIAVDGHTEGLSLKTGS